MPLKDKKDIEKVQLLQNVELFSSLSDEELEIVAYHSQMVHFPPGGLIFTENSTGHELYIIKQGEVLISKLRDDDKKIDLAQFIAGESFGELDLIGDTERNATAVALLDTEMLIFPKEGTTFTMVLQRYPRLSARLLYEVIGMIAQRLRRTHSLISEKTPWIQNLKKQLQVDKLTGLFNRNFLVEHFTSILETFKEPVSVIMVKPDNFKELNDCCGHEAGDKVLIMISIFIQSVMGEYDMVIRYGGDEYAAILPSTSSAEAIVVAKEVGRAIYDMDLREVSGIEDFKLTVSIGISTILNTTGASFALIEDCHDRMLRARERGGNRIVVHS